MRILKRLVAKLPSHWQLGLRKMHYARQIRRGAFVESEPEAALLPRLIAKGDLVIDVGANVGTFTKCLCDVVGATGRVVSFEPVPSTFAVLTANAQLFGSGNVTLLNAAVSDRVGLVGISIPDSSTGLPNFCQAHIVVSAGCAVSVLSMPLDALCAAERIALVKIDVEGHEAPVLRGMQGIVKEHRPVIIVETKSDDVRCSIESSGYVTERLLGSPNLLCRPIE